VTDNSAGIFFTTEDDTVYILACHLRSLFINDFKEFIKRGGQTFVGEQIKVVLKMPMTSLTGLSMDPERTEKNLIPFL
jgi:hypothetical protein